MAIKVFRLDLTSEQSAALVSHLETLIGANINHPHIAAPIAAGLEGGAAYLAQEYAVGDSFDVLLRQHGPMPLEDALPLVQSLADAIDHAASRGIHHGSLHLRDIILSADAPRITGFGIAAALTRVGATVPPRPQYSSPGHPSDVYSLGTIAFEAIIGRGISPETLQELEARHGPELREAFVVTLADTPDSRPDRARDFFETLRAASRGVQKNAAGPYEPHEPTHPDETHPPADPHDHHVRNQLGEFPVDDLDLRTDERKDPVVMQMSDDSTESRRWPIVVMFLLFAVVAALTVGFFLKSPASVAQQDSGAPVDETVVDLPAPAPDASSARVAPSGSAAPPPAPSRPASGVSARAETLTRGSLLIRSTPAEAEVTVNGRARGNTPLTLRDLDLGSYTIRVARDGYATDERKLQLTQRRPTASTTILLRTIPAAAAAGKGEKPIAAGKDGAGGLIVLSRPAGARVFVNDRPVGSTPLTMSELSAGPAAVRIEMDGYQTWTTKVRVNAGGQTRVAASLERQ